jgi:hypothetical protein
MHVGALQLLGDNESTLSASRPPSTIECGTKAVQSASLHQWLWLASLRVSELGS